MKTYAILKFRNKKTVVVRLSFNLVAKSKDLNDVLFQQRAKGTKTTMASGVQTN